MYIENGLFGETMFCSEGLKKQGHICCFDISYPRWTFTEQTANVYSRKANNNQREIYSWQRPICKQGSLLLQTSGFLNCDKTEYLLTECDRSFPPHPPHWSKMAASSFSLLQFWTVVTEPTRLLQEEVRTLTNSSGKYADMVASRCQSSVYGSVIYCVINHPQTYRFKTINIYYLSSWGQESVNNLAWALMGQGHS